jgi:dinuclear metal center YbgI/SA1388 family protein
MTRVQDLIQLLNDWAPPALAAKFDSIGLQLGDPKSTISEIILSLEVDEAVLGYLANKKNTLVITHHPLFFSAIKCIRYDQDLGQILAIFITGYHSLFSAHTNLDIAEHGVNDCLISHYGLDPKQGQIIKDGFGKFFDTDSLDFNIIKLNYQCQHKGSADTRPIKRIGFCCGSGHSLVSSLIQLGCDTFVTGEVTYHDEVSCRMNGVRLLVLGHKESEELILPVIQKKISQKFPNIPVQILASTL